jgi:phosphomevalonate kinase
MGIYKMKNETLEKYHKDNKLEILDSLNERIRSYLSPENKTINEVLSNLNEIEEEMQDSIGAIMRILKYQRHNAKLTEKQELKLIDAQNLKILIADVEDLKKWAEE